MESTVDYLDRLEPVNGTMTPPGMVSDDLQPTASVVMQVVAICIFTLLTVVGNALIILSIARFRVLQTITSAFILNLALGDFLIGITLMPVALVTCIKQNWVLGDVLCNISGVVNMLFPLASITTLSAIAIDRYYAIIKPLQYYSFMTRRTVAGFLIWVWCQSLLVALLPLTPWSSYKYDRSELLCLIDWNSSEITFAIFCLFVCIGVPLGIMSFCYYHILRVARKQSRRVQALRAFSTEVLNTHDSDTSATPVSGGTPEIQSRRCHQKPNPKKAQGAVRFSARENKSTAMMMMVMGAFLLAWTPYITGSLCKVIGRGCNWPNMYFTASVLIAMLQSSLNPFIYGVMDRRFRGAMKAIIFCSRRADRDTVTDHPRTATSAL